MKRFSCCLNAVMVASALAVSAPVEAQFVAPEPADLNMYFLMIDRFENGDPTNDSANPRANANYTSPSGIHGGDLEGIRQRLPYIRRLGCNALWITPFVENVTDYHGYGAYNFYNVEPGFGTLAKMKQLVEEANDLGIAIYFDIVCGHQGNLIDSRDSGYPSYRTPPAAYNLRWRNSNRYPLPFNDLGYYHAQGHIGNYVEPEQELGELSGLDDLKTESPYVRAEMTKIWQYWIRETGVSGFRVDTVKHVDLGFWQEFLPGVRAEAEALGRDNFFIFGEVYGADDNYMRKYVGTFQSQPYKFDSAVDFQFYYNAENVFARLSRPPSDMTGRLANRASALGAHHLMTPNFFDNHDLRRFLATANDNPGSGLAERLRRLELALAFLYTAPGIPVLYYGTEQGFDGGNDPYNREDMFDGQFETGPSLGNNFDENSTLYKFVAKLGSLRASLAPLRRGTMTTHAVSNVGPGALVFSRRYNGEAVVIAMNTSATATASIPSFTVSELAGQTVTNALDTAETLNLGPTGTFPGRILPAQAVEIWLSSGSIPPDQADVTEFIPADGDRTVPVDTAALEIRFLLPMDRAATESAISLTPVLPYTIEWNGESTAAILRLGAPLEARSTYTVTVSSAARSAEGGVLPVPRSATWTTARGAIVLPPLPAPLALRRSSLGPVADGVAAEWSAFPDLEENTATITAENLFCWQDALGDDTGPGTYAYPTDTNFSRQEADLDQFSFCYDALNLYVLAKVRAVNPTADFFTPWIGLAFNTAPGGMTRPMGFNLDTGQTGIAELDIRSDLAPEFEVAFTGPIGGVLIDPDGTRTALVAGYSQGAGTIEIAIPRALVGLTPNGSDRPLDLVVYTGLETFGGMREVAVNNAQWEIGGGIVEASDPDVFDLLGSDLAGQREDLAGYDDAYHSLVTRSVLRFTLREGPEAMDGWMIR